MKLKVNFKLNTILLSVILGTLIIMLQIMLLIHPVNAAGFVKIVVVGALIPVIFLISFKDNKKGE